MFDECHFGAVYHINGVPNPQYLLNHHHRCPPPFMIGPLLLCTIGQLKQAHIVLICLIGPIG